MADIYETSDSFRAGRRLMSPWGVVCLVLCLVMLLVVCGCGGCRKDPAKVREEQERKAAEQRAQRRKKEKKEDFELRPLVNQPGDRQSVGCCYKPGHWTSVVLPAKTNNFNFLGDLEISAVDGKEKPLSLEGAPFTLSGLRSVALPKGQPKLLQATLYVPPDRRQASARCRLRSQISGRQAFKVLQPLVRMPSYQYHFVVLARWPERYVFLNSLDSIKPPWDEFTGSLEEAYYRVSFLGRSRRAPLPSEALFWTSIAYVLWDDAEPASLDLDQQVALLDWLHWGGQLIVSGPDTLDTLRGSFLEDYLPARAAGVRELTDTDFDEINRRFTLPAVGKPGRPFVLAQPWTGVRLRKHPRAREVAGTGGLLVERRLGRGRIVVSAFRLSGRELITWPGFDGFFNACLLRRPPRRYREGADAQIELRWADGKYHRLDARQICKLHYFTRDTGIRFGNYAADLRQPDLGSGDLPPAGPGVAAWNDFTPVARRARQTLQTSARIEIPDRLFVVWVVAGYLLVLVPLNWAVFRAMNRVEWAWAAAPVIAVACSAVVIRLARLDIGFARSSTEIAVVEVQGHYPRAHVTRYVALYTSLSTSYDFQSEDPGVLVQPFPTVDQPEQFRLLPGQRRTELVYECGKSVGLRGYPVSSNATGLVHSEEMIDLGGPVSLAETTEGQIELINRTDYTLRGVGIVRRNDSGTYQTAWIGTIRPGVKLPVSFRLRSTPDGKWWSEERDRSGVTAAKAPPGELNLRRLVDLAQSAGELTPGQVRLVGWTTDPIPGLEISPPAPQARHAAVVLAHLDYGPGEDPRPDENTRADVK